MSPGTFTCDEELNGYIRFVESQEIYSAYPTAKDKKPAVSIDFAKALSADAACFIDTASQVLQEAGLTLAFTIDSI